MAKKKALIIYLYSDDDTLEVEIGEGVTEELVIELLQFALFSMDNKSGQWH